MAYNLNHDIEKHQEIILVPNHRARVYEGQGEQINQHPQVEHDFPQKHDSHAPNRVQIKNQSYWGTDQAFAETYWKSKVPIPQGEEKQWAAA